MRSLHKRISIPISSPAGWERKTKQAAQMEGGSKLNGSFGNCPAMQFLPLQVIPVHSIREQQTPIHFLLGHNLSKCYRALQIQNTKPNEEFWTEPGWEPSRDWSGEGLAAAGDSKNHWLKESTFFAQKYIIFVQKLCHHKNLRNACFWSGLDDWMQFWLLSIDLN